ncbi:ABC transporter permease [Eubacterium multiforme]|uniref:Cytochrome b561 n=1 Tax=Eubacterium multiforme TaxID=83339 RepID=A0ABT9UU94_9FIRM|nr:ABC transporter permease [Eubacterium multiforme]MDQ0149849.1 cytochrome b561 [Eubacterium multiforme]
MKNFKSLKILDKFKHIYEKFGVDYDTMRLIIYTKLTMDCRRTPTILNDNKNIKNKENKLTTALFFYAFFGFFLALMIVIKLNIFVQMSVFFGMFMFFIGTVFISDFSYVLLDVRDKNILSTKAISSKTISAAKITHIFIYILQITLALCGLSIIASIRYGIVFTLIFIVEIILVTLFMILLTTFIYFLILKFFDGEKLKDIINFVQIILSVGIMIFYQLVGRIFNFIDVNTLESPSSLLPYLLPSSWFAAPLQIIDSGHTNNFLIICTALAVILPILSIIIYFKISNSFEDYIQKLNNNSYKGTDKIPFSFKLSKLICKNPTERNFFNFTVNIIRSERTFKLKTYPNLAMAVFFPFLFLFIGIDDFSSIHNAIYELSTSKAYFALYIQLFVLAPVPLMCRYSENYKGSYIYKSVPFTDTSNLYKGVFKGSFYRLIFPTMILAFIPFFIIYPIHMYLNLLAIILSLLIVSLILFKTMDKYFPFSNDFSYNGNTDGIAIYFFGFFLSIVAGILHFSLSFLDYGVYILIGIYLILLILLWNRTFKVNVEKIKY